MIGFALPLHAVSLGMNLAEIGNPQSMVSAFAGYLTARDVGRSVGFGLAGLLIGLASYQAVFTVAFLASCAALFTLKRYVRSDG